MKTCVTCKHHRPALVLGFPLVSTDFDKCAAIPDPVNGGPGSYCSIQRKYGFTKCGASGQLWEEKESAQRKRKFLAALLAFFQRAA